MVNLDGLYLKSGRGQVHRKGAKDTKIFSVIPRAPKDLAQQTEFYEISPRVEDTKPKRNNLCAFAVQLYFSRPRMRLVIHPGEMLEIQVRVNLRGAQVGVTQQLLYRAQVAGRFENMRGE